MFKTVIAGIDGSFADADALALARLLVQPGGAVIPIRIQPGPAVGPGLHEAALAPTPPIAVGSSGRGLLGRILAGDEVIGDAAQRAVRRGDRAARVRSRGGRRHRRIGVGYDGSAHAQAALDEAKRSPAGRARACARSGSRRAGRARHADGHSGGGGARGRRERAERAIAKLGLPLAAHVVDGIAHQRLAELSSQVDLLVVGSSAPWRDRPRPARQHVRAPQPRGCVPAARRASTRVQSTRTSATRPASISTCRVIPHQERERAR